MENISYGAYDTSQLRAKSVWWTFNAIARVVHQIEQGTVDTGGASWNPHCILIQAFIRRPAMPRQRRHKVAIVLHSPGGGALGRARNHNLANSLRRETCDTGDILVVEMAQSWMTNCFIFGSVDEAANTINTWLNWEWIFWLIGQTEVLGPATSMGVEGASSHPLVDGCSASCCGAGSLPPTNVVSSSCNVHYWNLSYNRWAWYV